MTLNNRGYYTYNVRGKSELVHRLVAEYFVPNPNNYPVVNHKDCNQLNNGVDNLEWCTQRHNVKHCVKNRKDLEPFKNNSNGIAVVNYQSGAVGINDLCISNIGIFYGPPDGDHILMEQAKSRLDRIGQTKQPVFYYLQTVGSVEKAIYKELSQGRDFDAKMFEAWLNEQK